MEPRTTIIISMERQRSESLFRRRCSSHRSLANPADQWHEDALRMANQTLNDDLVTTEDVLIELLNFYAESGEFMRKKVADLATFAAKWK